ncbi:MAG TPA: methionyl-tRNA formyltransferase [Terriglobia bacterium]|nr:methionyl-tRNA formyltransferase [Terriglobia bacterium]
MRIIFCGTPQFAVPTLEQLIEEKFEIGLVVTNPDEPQGRGYQMKASPVKEAAARAGLKVFQPAKLKDPSVQEVITSVHPEAIIVVAYGHIIPGWMIDLPPFGAINLHASLLPKYRGAAPIPWSIVRGESVTGVTTMKIGRGLDTGPILLQEEIAIGPGDTSETLVEQLSVIGASLMMKTLRRIESANIEPRPQDESVATYAPILRKEDGRIEWKKSADEIWKLVRGMRPWPTAFTTFRGRGLQIWAVAPAAEVVDSSVPSGTLRTEPKRLLVACGDSSWLEIQELQLEGRRRMGATEFLNGVRLRPDDKLGGP